MGQARLSSCAMLLALGRFLAIGEAKADNNDILNGVLEGRTYGGLDHFYVSNQDANLIGDKLPLFRWSDDSFVVDRKEDPDQIKCMQKADAGWVFGVLKATVPGADVAAAVLADTKFDEIPDCNAQWHEKFYKVAVATHFSMLSAQIYEHDTSMRKELEKLLDTVDIKLISLKNGQIDNTTALDSLNDQMVKLTKSHSELANALAVAADREKIDSCLSG